MGSLGYREQFTWGKEQDKEQDPEPPVSKRHWGKYRGTVVENQDVPPKGRLLVSVPGIVITNWAMPCVPFASIYGGSFVRPEIGSNVWVEFERGDPDKPIWTGGWWGDAQIPFIAEQYNAEPAVSVMTIESASAGISVSDAPMAVGLNQPGNVNLKAGFGEVTIALSPTGVSINAPQVMITTTGGPFTVVTPTGTFTVA
jgi:uncharacterized protein involved in type VI secretion and phage assembly